MLIQMWIKECGNTFGENMREIYRKFTSIDEARDWGKKNYSYWLPKYQLDGKLRRNYDTENPVVAMEIEGYGAIVMELYPKIAPNTVNNFISLVLDKLSELSPYVSLHKYVNILLRFHI